ncbi:MAG: cellulase family glycosylhydrolase, partial [Chloroflexus sp.]
MYRHRLIFVLVMWLIAVALPAAAQTPTNISTIYLPLVSANTIRPLGFETNSGWLYHSGVYPQAANLNAHWVRLNTLSWREAQPTVGSPINWSAPSFTRFEAEVAAANALGLQVMAIIDDHPSWATGSNHICAAILDQYHDEFAAFVRAVVAKYSQAPYYVRYWELGNEPDVDPRLVGENFPFGCWGVIEDEYYGGERYGRMLMTVTPQIRAADPGAKVVFGGLLLARPENGPTNNDGKPFNFLEGALRAGAGPYFDILAFHSYPTYFEEVGVNNAHVDFDKHPRTFGGVWASRGGATLGKMAFLREVMQRYGINKPLFLNETG